MWWRLRAECDRRVELVVVEVVALGSVVEVPSVVSVLDVVAVLVVSVLAVGLVVVPERGGPPVPVHAQATPPPLASETTAATTAALLRWILI